MMTEEQYLAHVKRIDEAKKKEDKKKAADLSKALWDILSEDK